MVSIQGLSRSYGGVRAVREVDITVAAGEILGLIGPNGAGKTTLVNMVTGLTAPTTGTGTVVGTTLNGSTKAHVIAQAGVARTFRQITLFNRLSALENVRVGLGDKAAIAAGDLSYGDQRRLEIARALASHPSLVVLGEPADGIAVLVIEHKVRMMLETCDRVMVLNCGEGIASGAPGSMAANIERVYERFPVLHERRQLAAGALSGGEQQMLAIALALIAELLADEKIIEAYLGIG